MEAQVQIDNAIDFPLENVDGESVSKIEIKKIRLHQIDASKDQCKFIEITGSLDDLSAYLERLLLELHGKKERRSYKPVRETTEFFSALLEFQRAEGLADSRCDTLANRLLDQEKKVENSHGHLVRKGRQNLVKKGSFLQFLFKDNEKLGYLGVKLEHQTFVDEVDFRTRSGLPDSSKVYKACSVIFDTEEFDIQAYDTNSSPSVYWWRDFLELMELRNDSYNTNTAIKAVVRTINTFKRDFPLDTNILRNAAIGAFKQEGRMNYEEFLEKTFSKYEPHDSQLKMESLLGKLRKLPEKYNFDTQFELSPNDVDFRRTKIDITNEIAISFDSDMKDINNKIWSEKTKEGKNLVVIESDIAHEQFILKIRE